MAWIGMLGSWVGSLFGASWAAGSFTSFVVGGAIVGAAVGAVYSIATGYNIGKGILYGAIGGAAIGAGGYALGFGATSGATSIGMSENAVAGMKAAGSTPVAFGKTAADAGSTLFSAKDLFSKEGMSTVGTLAALGSDFMKAGYQGDYDAEALAIEREKLEKQTETANKNIEAQKEMAAKNVAATMAGIASRERIATADRLEGARQFNEKIGFEKDIDRMNREEAEEARERQEEGVEEAAKYVRGNVRSVSLVKSNRSRRDLRRPIWLTEQQQPQTAQADQAPQEQPQQQTGILTMGA